MSLLNDILIWTKTLPFWQRDAARRLFQNESGLSENDYKELYLLFKSEHGITNNQGLVPSPLAAEHIPAENKSGETVILKTLRNLENVNRIPNDQVLKFEKTGITIIYGENGSGKSGYARVMKHACRARDQTEPVHPDANDPNVSKKIPSAKFEIDIDGKSEEVCWSRDAAPPNQLSTISVFDLRCARSYITEEHEVAYLPYGLDIVENLANKVLPKIKKFLDEEIASISIDKQPFGHLLGETAVGKQIGELSAKSDATQITTLGTLGEDEVSRLKALKKTLREANPLAKASELQMSANRLNAFGEKMEKSFAWVGDATVKKLEKLAEDKRKAEQDEKQVAAALQGSEALLPGTGEKIWKVLFEAARNYSIKVACPGEKFPILDDGSVCPLCQVPLSGAARTRLQRFDDYIKQDIATTAKNAREKIREARDKIQQVDLQIGIPEISDELQSLKKELPEIVRQFEANLIERKNQMLSCLDTHEWSKIPKLLESPSTLIQSFVAQKRAERQALIEAADTNKKQAFIKEHDELVAREKLANTLTPILTLLRQMQDRYALEKCQPSIRTRSISDKSKEFVNKAVTQELGNALNEEFERLGIGSIKTKLRERGHKGKTLHRLGFSFPTTIKIDEILSEGEQRAIALGSFLAELTLANHFCGIVFDDPVSSLDHSRRQQVACRLVEEAKVRQVVIFTHDTSFLGQIRDEIKSKNVPKSIMFLDRQADRPGRVFDGLPWDHMGYKERIDYLEKAQREIAQSSPPYPKHEETRKIGNLYSMLRATLERVIQDVVFNGVVERYRDWIRVSSLGGVVGFEQSECESIMQLYARINSRVSAHDSASAKSAAPTVEELGADIETLKDIANNIKARQN